MHNYYLRIRLIYFTPAESSLITLSTALTTNFLLPADFCGILDHQYPGATILLYNLNNIFIAASCS